MKRNWMWLMFVAAAAFAQNWQVGAAGGVSAVGASDLPATASASAGVQVCGLCSGRFAVFAEYSHMETSGGPTWGIKRYDIAAGGLRIQGRGRVRPFFDIGFAFGTDQYGSKGQYRHGTPGMVLAGGVTFPLKNSWYIRPQYRMYGFTYYHAVAGVNLEVGVRF
jgi:hypothetical protein